MRVIGCETRLLLRCGRPILFRSVASGSKQSKRVLHKRSPLGGKQLFHHASLLLPNIGRDDNHAVSGWKLGSPRLHRTSWRWLYDNYRAVNTAACLARQCFGELADIIDGLLTHHAVRNRKGTNWGLYKNTCVMPCGRVCGPTKFWKWALTRLNELRDSLSNLFRQCIFEPVSMPCPLVDNIGKPFIRSFEDSLISGEIRLMKRLGYGWSNYASCFISDDSTQQIDAALEFFSKPDFRFEVSHGLVTLPKRCAHYHPIKHGRTSNSIASSVMTFDLLFVLDRTICNGSWVFGPRCLERGFSAYSSDPRHKWPI